MWGAGYRVGQRPPVRQRVHGIDVAVHDERGHRDVGGAARAGAVDPHGEMVGQRRVEAEGAGHGGGQATGRHGVEERRGAREGAHQQHDVVDGIVGGRPGG